MFLSGDLFMAPSNPQSLVEFLAKIQQTPESVEFQKTRLR